MNQLIEKMYEQVTKTETAEAALNSTAIAAQEFSHLNMIAYDDMNS